MYTKIPMFKEIILSSFYCDACGFKNTEVQFGGKLADSGVHYKLTVDCAENLNRSVVKSEFATIRIPELDFEIPPQTQKGSVNTVEGFLMKSIEGISDLQEQRRKMDEMFKNLTEAQQKAATEGPKQAANFEDVMQEQATMSKKERQKQARIEAERAARSGHLEMKFDYNSEARKASKPQQQQYAVPDFDSMSAPKKTKK